MVERVRSEDLLAALPKAVAIVRPADGVVTYVNARCAGAYPGMLGRGLGAAFGATSAAAAHAAIAAQFRAGAEEAAYATPAMDAANNVRLVNITVTLLEAAEDWVWLAVLEDSATAASVPSSERGIEALSLTGLFGVFRGVLPPTPDAGMTTANEAFLRMTGWSRDEIHGGALRGREIKTPLLSHGDALQFAAELRSNGFLAMREIYLTRKDGGMFPVLLAAALTATNEFVAIILDRTEHVRQRAALDTSDARYAAICNAGVIGVVVAEPSGRILDVNEACARMLGYTRREFLDRCTDLVQITPDDWLEATAEGRHQMRARGFGDPYRKELIHRDGHRVLVLVAPIRVDEHHAIGLVIDLSGQRKAEEALRTSEEQLRHMQKMEAVGRLAGGVAHDFNNMLSVILSYVSLVKDQIPDGVSWREDLDEIDGAAKRAADLTRQLLLFSRQQVAETRLIDLNDCLRGLEKLLSRLLREDVELAMKLGPDIGMVRVDPAHLDRQS